MDYKRIKMDNIKTAPYSNEAEQAVLGSLIQDNNLLSEAVITLQIDDFYIEAHRKIYKTIVELYNNSQPVDLITLTNTLKEKNLLDKIGGVTYLNELVDSVPTSANFFNYEEIVYHKSLLRKLINICNEILSMAYAENENVMDILDKAEKMIFDISQKRIKNDFIKIGDLLSDTITQIEKLYDSKDYFTGIQSGLKNLDNITSGFQNSDLIIIAARPSVGKSSLALNIAEFVAIELKKPVGIFTLEMSKSQILLRMLASQSRVDLHKIRTGYLSSKDWTPILTAASEISDAPIYIDDTPGINILEIRAKARRAVLRYNIELLIIDYLQLITITNTRKENRQQEISEISRFLKSIARELNIPVIALSQLNRKAEERGGEPKLADIRESGAIEQDADVVIFLHREDNKKKDEDEEESAFKKNILKYKLIVAKQRNGPTDSADIIFFKNITRFADAEKHSEIVEHV